MDSNASASSGHSQKDVSNSRNFLSKTSNSFRRSPSKRHKSQPSDQMPTLDGTLLDLRNQSAPSSRSTATQYRPGFNRAPSAPVTVQILKTATVNASKDEQIPHSATEATMASAPFANSIKREPTSNLSKATSASPIGENMNFATTAQGLPPTAIPPVAIGNQNPKAIYQHIHEMASKRISTLDYMRKASVYPWWLSSPERVSILIERIYTAMKVESFGSIPSTFHGLTSYDFQTSLQPACPAELRITSSLDSPYQPSLTFTLPTSLRLVMLLLSTNSYAASMLFFPNSSPSNNTILQMDTAQAL
jgi:hypothetical protein